MVLINPELGVKLVFLLGITNIVLLLLVFFSCRCLAGINFINRMFRHKWYRRYYYKHCWFWWFFFASVIAHTILAFLIFGNPFLG